MTPKLTDLTDEQINVLIAEAMGFRFEIERNRRRLAKTRIWLPNGHLGAQKAGKDADALRLAMADCVPDYCRDLDGMHEAEKALDVDIESPDSPRYAYARYLYELTDPPAQPMRATAKQRAQAFLICVGKAVQ